MDPNEARVAIIAIVMTFGSMITLAWLWFNRGKQNPAPTRQDHDQAERLARIEQALDSIAVEVERISEGQRFTTRLLADREHESRPEGAARRGG